MTKSIRKLSRQTWETLKRVWLLVPRALLCLCHLMHVYRLLVMKRVTLSPPAAHEKKKQVTVSKDEKKKRRERRDYLQFIHRNSVTLSEKANALIFPSAGDEGCAALRLKSIGQQRSRGSGGVKDGATDQRAGLYKHMQIEYCVLVYTGPSGVTVFVAGLQSLCTRG